MHHFYDNNHSRWSHIPKMQQHFWQSWSKEYLNKLQQAQVEVTISNIGFRWFCSNHRKQQGTDTTVTSRVYNKCKNCQRQIATHLWKLPLNWELPYYLMKQEKEKIRCTHKEFVFFSVCFSDFKRLRWVMSVILSMYLRVYIVFDVIRDKGWNYHVGLALFKE